MNVARPVSSAPNVLNLAQSRPALRLDGMQTLGIHVDHTLTFETPANCVLCFAIVNSVRTCQKNCLLFHLV